MSPLLRNCLYIGFSPNQVSVLGFSRGPKPKVLFEMDEAVGGLDSQKPWQGAIEKLAVLLDKAESQGLDAEVVLSDRVVHYATVNFDRQLKKYPEQEAYARHVLSQLFGHAAAHWELRIMPGKAGKPALVSGVELNLLDGLRRVCAERKIRLRSIKPRMMVVVNRFRKIIKDEPLWLVIAEPGYSFIALAHEGGIAAVSGICHEDLKELPVLLDRENLVAALPEPCKRVALYLPGVAELNRDSWSGYEITSLAGEMVPATSIGISLAWDGVM